MTVQKRRWSKITDFSPLGNISFKSLRDFVQNLWIFLWKLVGLRSLYAQSFRSKFENTIFSEPGSSYRDLMKKNITTFRFYPQKGKNLLKLISYLLYTVKVLSFYRISRVGKNRWFSTISFTWWWSLSKNRNDRRNKIGILL